MENILRMIFFCILLYIYFFHTLCSEVIHYDRAGNHCLLTQLHDKPGACLPGDQQFGSKVLVNQTEPVPPDSHNIESVNSNFS